MPSGMGRFSIVARFAFLALLFVLSSVMPSPAAAANNTSSQTTMSPQTITAYSSYHVSFCGVRRSTLTYVDTVGLDFFNRSAYMSDGNGCVAYTAVSGRAGQYGVSVQQMRGSNLIGVLSWTFWVR